MALPSLRDFTSGVGQGWNTGQQMFDAGVAGLARAAGYQNVARDWERSADEQALEAQRYANPTTQVAPWREGGGGWENAAPWLVNQAGQLIGGAAPLVAGGAAGMALAPVLPEAAGGIAAGLGMGLASYPQAVGANYQAAREANQAQNLGEVTPEQATSAAQWGVPSAALNAFAPTRAVGVGKSAAQMASRTMLDAAKGVAQTGVDNALATAGQKAIEHSFRPDMSDGDKTRDMLDSVVTGFIGGAGMGAAGEGVGRIVKAIRPDTPTADLDAATKQVLEPEKAVETRQPEIEGDVSFLDDAQPQGIEQTKALNRAFENEFDPRLAELGKQREAAIASGDPQALIDWERNHVQFLKDVRERDEGFLNAGAREETAPPDVPKQYLVEAERAARDGTLDQRMAAAEQGGDTLRSKALGYFKNLLADETGALNIKAYRPDGSVDLGFVTKDAQQGALNDLGKEFNRLHTRMNEAGEFTEETLPIRSLISTQEKVNPDFASPRDQKNDGYDLPAVFKYDGKYYVGDGHHRIANAALTSDTAKVRLFDMDKARGIGVDDPNQLSLGLKTEQQAPTITRDVGGAIKRLLKDETGSLRISSGADEAADFQALIDKKEGRVQEPQRIHSFLQQMGGIYETDETRGHLEQFASIDDRTKKNSRGEILHAAEPIERRIRAKDGQGVDIQEATKQAIDAGYLPEDATPNELVELLHKNQDEPVYSALDQDDGQKYQAQRQAKQLDETIKSYRIDLKSQFADQPKAIIDEAAHMMATGEYAPEEAIMAAQQAKIQRERDLTPAVEGFADSAFMEPAEGVDVEGWRSKSPKQFRVEAKKLWETSPDDLDLAAAKYESEGDTARATAYREYQAEQFAKKKPIVREVGGTKAVFRETPKGIERVPTPDDAMAPVDRPAGTPAIDGPLGRAEAVPPLPPKEAIPPKPAAVLGGGGGGEPPKPPASGGGGGEPPERPRAPISVTAPKDIDSRLSRFLQQVDFGSLGDAARKIGLYVTTNHHHDEMYGHIMPSQLLYSKATAFKAALSQRMQAHGMARQAELRDFAKRNDAIAKDTMQLERAYQLGINPAKDWGEQSERVRTGDNGTYKELHQKYKSIYDRLSKMPSGLDMHNSIREQYDTHWTSKPSAVLYTVLNDLADLPEDLKAQIVDPSEILINNPDEGVARTPSQANRVFADALEKNLEIAKAHIKDNPDKFNQILGDLVTEIESQKGKLKDVPYSALVRSGKYGIGFRLAHGLEKGIIDDSALARVQESIKKAGFDNVVIEPLANSDYVFIRSDNSTKINNLKSLLVEHAKAGDIQEKDFEAGSMDVFSKSPAASKTINKLINQIENDEKYKPHDGDSEEMVKSRDMRRKQMVSALRELSIDFLPEASMEKYSAHREYIPGFESDPLRAMAKQSIENAQQVSGLLGTYRVQKALAEQLKEWEASKNPLDPINKYEPIMAALYGRNMGKEEFAGIKLGGSLWDAAQSLNYSYYLGFNPSFGIIQMSQIPMYVIPELGKKYGFMKAGTAIANSFSPSMKILGAVLEEAKKAGNGALADMPITVEALTKAGLDDETARYMVHMVNRGGIDTGGLARSLGHIAENRTGGKLDKFTRWASAIGYYGETLSRIQTALAAKEVFKNYKNKDGSPRYDLKNPEHWNKLIDESHRVLDEALFDYSQENRATGFSDDPRSLLGRGTKLAFAFQAYWMMAVEKQYREWHKMLTTADPAARKEAAKFIVGHLGATALIAGSLGLPGMTVFQRVYEKIADELHPEGGPHDMREEWTKWLEMHLGPSLGDAFAYGAPRLAGMDWSKRTGEQDFAPLPTFLFDRGTHKDAFNKWALSKMGPAEGAVANWMASIDKYNAGDTWGAVTGLLPAAGFRNASTTIQAMKEGHYRDSKGHVVPNVDVTGSSIASGFAGFTPKNLAREREDNAMLHRYDTSIELDARNLVMPMVEALRSGDKAAFNRMLPAAKKFEKDHPGHDIVGRAKTTYENEYKKLNKAVKTGMPYERYTKDPKRKKLGLPSLRNQ